VMPARRCNVPGLQFSCFPEHVLLRGAGYAQGKARNTEDD
jgi:hypothetical protein